MHPNEVKLTEAAQIGQQIKALLAGELNDESKATLRDLSNKLEGLAPTVPPKDEAAAGLSTYVERHLGDRTTRAPVNIPEPKDTKSYDNLLSPS